MRRWGLIALFVVPAALSPAPMFGQAIVHDRELTGERAKTAVLQELNYDAAVRVREIVREKLDLLGRKTKSLTTARGYQEMLSRGELSVLGDTAKEWTRFSDPCRASEDAESVCSAIDSIAGVARDLTNALIIERVVDRPWAEANYKLFSTIEEARDSLSQLALSELPGFDPELQEAEQENINAQAEAAVKAEERARAIAQLVEEIQEEERLNSEPISSGRAAQITALAELARAMVLLESTREHVLSARIRAFETGKKVANMRNANTLSSLSMF